MSTFEHKPIGWVVKRLMETNQAGGQRRKELEAELMKRGDEYADWCRKNPTFLDYIWTGDT